MVTQDLPARIGPVVFGKWGSWVTVRCPRDLRPLLRQAGAMWEPGAPQWLLELRRNGPVVRQLRREADPLFRRAGLELD